MAVVKRLLLWLSCRISVENIELEFSSLYVRIKCLEEKVQEDQELQQQLEAFLQVQKQPFRPRLDFRAQRFRRMTACV